MGVPVCDVDAFMPYPIRDSDGAESHVDQQAHMAVPYIVDPDPFYTGFLCSAIHFVVQVTFRDREDTVFLFDPVQHFR